MVSLRQAALHRPAPHPEDCAYARSGSCMEAKGNWSVYMPEIRVKQSEEIRKNKTKQKTKGVLRKGDWGEEPQKPTCVGVFSTPTKL